MRCLFVVSMTIAASMLELSAVSLKPEPAASDGKASAFRTSFEASMLAACKRKLTVLGVPQAEIEFSCPCMTKELLANAPTDRDLVAHANALEGTAVEKCVALADERFPRP